MADNDINELDSQEVSVGSRKRKRNEEQWERNVLKKKRASGVQFQMKNERIKPSRRTGLSCGCKRNCFSLICDSEKATIISEFNSLSVKDIQDSHLFGLIGRNPVQRHRIRNGSRGQRSFSYTYSTRGEGVHLWRQPWGLCKEDHVIPWVTSWFHSFKVGNHRISSNNTSLFY